MRCPAEEDIAGFARGTLDPSVRSAVEEHLDVCPECARVIVGLARMLDDATVLPAGDPVIDTSATQQAADGGGVSTRGDGFLLQPGALVGRYRLLECVGVGGMGAVYAAYDPELDRRVALKLLRGDDSRDRDRNRRLQREAKALAKLSHPNVITVHDVGTADGRVFIAMEFVEGETLGRWMKKPRRWREVRDVFAAAGSGLAAAHSVGLVHRDFKPDNVLIGNDGRVRVTDFGLARLGPDRTAHLWSPNEAAEDLWLAEGEAEQRTLTRTGAIVGTPAYMAPEQYESGRVDAKSDQFSFCVALYEAIHGSRPFQGKTLGELAANVALGKIRPADREGPAPRAVKKAVVRGLSPRPDERFETMAELLAVVTHRPTRAARRWATALLPPLLVGAFVWSLRDDDPAVDRCRLGSDLHDIWNDDRRSSIRAALLSTALPDAEHMAHTVQAALSTWATRHDEQFEHACELVRAKTAESKTQWLLRTRCLEDQRARFAAMLDVIESADVEVARRALAAVESLQDPGRCENDGVLATEPVLTENARELQHRLTRVEALSAGGRFEEALALVIALREEARTLANAPVVAEATYWVGHILRMLDRLDEADPELEEAAWIATEGRHFRIAAESWLDLGFLHATLTGDVPKARRALRAAWASHRAGSEATGTEQGIRTIEGMIAHADADLDGATRAFEAAHAICTCRSPAALGCIDIAMNLAAIQAELGHHEVAREHFEKSLASLIDRLGEHHPRLAAPLVNLGMVNMELGRLDVALASMQRAASIQTTVFGFDSSDRAKTLLMIGSVLMRQQRRAEARENVETAVRVLTKVHGLRSLRTLHAKVELAHVLIELGENDEAREILNTATTVLAEHPEQQALLISVLQASARLASREGRPLEAVASLREAIEQWESLAPDHPGRIDARTELARQLFEAGEIDEARDVLESLRRDVEQGAIAPRLAGRIFFESARVLLERDPEEAVELATRARALFIELEQSDLVEAADAWLESHAKTKAP